MIRHLFKLFFVLFVLSFAQSAWASCTVNGTSYKTNGGSGTAITTAIIKNRASSWNNATDLVTTCDVSSITDMTDMFKNNSAINQDLSAWDTSNVTNMTRMFFRSTAVTSVTFQDTSEVTNMFYMFFQATSLRSVSLPETGKVWEMSVMFYGATSLTSVYLPKTGAVTNWSLAFGNATSLTSVSLPETGAAQEFHSTFLGATSLTSVHLPKLDSLNNVQQMFRNASSFNQDIREWDVTGITDFERMFEGATAMISRYSSTPNWPADNKTPTAAWFSRETTVPTISGVSLNAANNALTVTFSEGVHNTTGYNNTLCSCDLEASDFALAISGGSATVAATPTSITKTSQTVWVLGLNVSGTANGSETISVVPASSTSIYDGASNAASTTQSGNTASLNEKIAPTISSASLNAANSTLTVTFSENVYDTNGGSGDLEASDFALAISGGSATVAATPTSITKTSQTVWVLGLNVSGTANGSETISVVPASSTSIYDGASNAASTTQSGNTASLNEKIAPTISSASLNAANSTLTVTFSENVYDTNGGSGDLEASDFALAISGGSATVNATPSSITKTSQAVWVLGLNISGTPTGAETLTVVPASSTSIYDGAANATSTTQSGNTASLTEKVVPTLSNVSLASNNATTTEGFAGDVVTLTFTADETIGTPVVTFKSGGDAVTDESITYANATGNTWTAAYTVNASDTAGAVTYSIAFSDSVSNAGTAVTSGTGSVTIYPTPAAAFAAELTKINAKIASFAQAELNNLSSTMSGISSSARGRFIAQMKGSQIKVSSTDPDYSGGFTTSGGTIDTNLTMTKSSKSHSSLYTTYSSYDVFYNKSKDNSLSRGVAGQIQWERMLSDQTMLGYFVGGSIGFMDEAGTLKTSMQAVGLKLGSYFVRELEGNLILDGYASVVTSSNNLRFTTDLMTAKSNYNTQAGAVGLNLTGIIPLASVEIRPTGSLSLTRSIGQTVNFDVSVGSASSTETATHGSITQSKLSFAPEVRMPFSQTSFGGSSVATFTPKVTCQQLVKTTTTRNCGQGIALGLDTISKDGLTNVIVGTSFDRMGGQSSTSIKLKVMKQW